jgi:hypothetical protein
MEVLTTPIPNIVGLTIEENEIIGTEPITLWPRYGSQEAVMRRHSQAKKQGYQINQGFENNMPVLYAMTESKEYKAMLIDQTQGEITQMRVRLD